MNKTRKPKKRRPPLARSIPKSSRVASRALCSRPKPSIPLPLPLAVDEIPAIILAHRLSRKKPANLKFLHQTLFGRRGKAVNFKSHLLQFSGFVWHENEEKQRAKIKEKLDKCVKDTLVDLCDLFDIPISKATIRKDLVTHFSDFQLATLGNFIIHESLFVIWTAIFTFERSGFFSKYKIQLRETKNEARPTMDVSKVKED